MLTLLLLLLVISLILLYKSGENIVESGKRIASKLGMSDFLFALLVVSVGTSLPEIVVSMVAALQGQPHIVSGDILGSNIADILLLIGTYSLVSGLVVGVSFALDLAASISLAGLALTYALLRGSIYWIDAVILIVPFLAFLRVQKTEVKNIESGGGYVDTIVLLLSFVVLSISAYTAVKAVTIISWLLDASPFVVSALTLALGTSLPELSVGLNALKKGRKEMAFGDALGSLVVNSTLGLSLPAIISPIPVFLPEERLSIFLLLFSLFLLLLAISWRKKLEKKAGVLFLILYLFYVLHLLQRL